VHSAWLDPQIYLISSLTNTWHDFLKSSRPRDNLAKAKIAGGPPFGVKTSVREEAQLLLPFTIESLKQENIEIELVEKKPNRM